MIWVQSVIKDGKFCGFVKSNSYQYLKKIAKELDVTPDGIPFKFIFKKID